MRRPDASQTHAQARLPGIAGDGVGELSDGQAVALGEDDVSLVDLDTSDGDGK
ncbi:MULTISPECIES: hypothetical protein [unclassified Streptomyces]|uniref:hypothetical protein n=1 Tax=unclassified Streptomyces TaxID=2593676 RepID=UPI0013313628|nr:MULTISPECIES: hypothetical protein [unclassified Streptomyces]MCP3771450.1 hypothetical protein [Streptomyces sp. MAR25Y5]